MAVHVRTISRRRKQMQLYDEEFMEIFNVMILSFFMKQISGLFVVVYT